MKLQPAAEEVKVPATDRDKLLLTRGRENAPGSNSDEQELIPTEAP